MSKGVKKMMKNEGSEKKSKLLFTGELKNNKLKIDRKLNFSDVLQLIKSQTSKPYQKIPIVQNASYIFQYIENGDCRVIHLRFDSKNNFIYVKEGDVQSAYPVLSNFLIMAENRITYMTFHPNSPEIEKIKKQILHQLEIKRIEDW